MADLLGSILNSMDKPPSIANKEKEYFKKQKEEFEKKREEEKEKLKVFRNKIETKINKFIQDPTQQKYKFPPADKVYRSIMHDVADVAGLTAFSFGDDEIDRYVMVFKKEFAPSDEELQAYRKGEEWDPEKAKLLALEKEMHEKQEAEACQKKEKIIPNSNYQDKYERLIGKEAAKEAARVTKPNKQFGFVPSENKRDQRSIEQTLADIRAKKKMKTEQQD